MSDMTKKRSRAMLWSAPIVRMKRAALILIAVSFLAAVNAFAVSQPAGPDPDHCWDVRSDVKYLYASDTSYQFGNTDVEPGGKPLSRLEFPLNTIWVGGELRRNFPLCSIGCRALTSVMRNTYGRMKDSDWTNDANPDERTIFSTSSNRMEYGLMIGGDIDMKIAGPLGLPRWLDLRPLIGMEWQQFSIMAHDGVQQEYNPPSADLALAGNSIHFRQDYWQYYIGARAAADMGRPLGLSSLAGLAEVRWALVTGDNEDHHLLREGNRFTFEKTMGWGFYVSTGFRAGLTKNLTFGASVDYLIIRTTGRHRLYNEPLGEDLTWSKAVKVWSDQSGVTLDMTYRF